ncbi:hypothetical protein FRC04_008520 [Tulasnella sp. 424]|nr:hypothetical protein FRC04_008520 [Tulasnella sp. 424]
MDSKTFKFGAYQKDDVFLNPPPSIPSKPKSNTQPKKSTTNARRIIGYDYDMSTLDDSAGPEPPKKSSLRIKPAEPSRVQPTSAVDNDSNPNPSTKRKALGQSTSGKAASVAVKPAPPPPLPSLSQTSTSSRNVSAPAKSSAEGKQAAASSTIAEDGDYYMEERDGNGDSNMSMSSVVDRNQTAESRAGRLTKMTTTVGTKTLDIMAMITTVEWTLMNRSKIQFQNDPGRK